MLAVKAYAAGDATKGKASYAVCMACHGADGMGNKALNAPRIAGQESWYLERQLKNFKAGIRGADPKDKYGMQMRPMALTLANDQAVADIAAYVSSLPEQKPVAKTFIEIAELDGDPVIIAVYDFLDMTGQKKPGGNFASMSTAVTQGSYQLLIKALQDAGDGKWFRVVERASLPSLLQERKLIRSTRQQVDGDQAEPLPPLLFAGAYLTGGIVGYDSDVKTGGYGARILGIQAHKQWRQDVVTVILRLVNVQSGEVILSIVVEKTIISGETGGDVFKYFDADTLLLEVEIGVARNEPVTFAVRKAIEKAIVELIKEGDEKDIWKIQVEEVTSGFENSEDIPDKVVEDIPDKIVIEQQEPNVERTYEEYKAEKKAKKLALLEEKKAKKEALKAEKLAKKEAVLAKKHLKKVQKNELAWYNKKTK